jgi:hypothetical protein
MLERGCTAGRNKKVVTVYGETYNCSALKWIENTKVSKGQTACISRH